MVKWSIKYNSIIPDAPNPVNPKTHYAVVYAKDLGEALDKIEKLTGEKIGSYGFNMEELKNGIK